MKGNQLKAILKQKGITQAWLADKVGVGERQVRHWCADTQRPSVDNAMAVSRAVGVEIEKIWRENK